MSRIDIGSWVWWNTQLGTRMSGLVVGAASNGITRTLTVRTDLGGPDITVQEMWCEIAPPPRSCPRLVVDNGERVSP